MGVGMQGGEGVVEVVDAARGSRLVRWVHAGVTLGGSMVRRPPRPGRHIRRSATVAILVVAVLAPSACTAAPAQSSSGVTHAAADGHAELQLAQGLSIVAPAHSLTAGTTLSGKVATAPGPAPDGLQLSGPTYDLHVSSAPLAAMTLSVPVPPTATVAGGSPRAALLAYFDPARRAWVPVEATFDPATGMLRAQTTHLSTWTVLVLDTKAALSGATRALMLFIGTNATAGQPQCSRGDQAKSANVTAVSDTGSLVGWCLGLTGAGGPLVRVANKRGYAIEVDYPAGWAVQRVGPPESVVSQAVNAIVKDGSPPAGGGQSIIVPGGESIELSAAVGSSGMVRATPSSLAYLASGLLYGVDTLAMTFGTLPGMTADASKTAKAIALAFEGGSCLTQMDALAHTDVSSPYDVGLLFRSAAELATGCLGSHWEVAYGLAGARGSFAVGVVLWFGDGIKLVLQGAQAAVETGIYWRDYRIAVTTAAPSPLTVTSAPVPPISLPNYQTSGSYPQVSGGGLDLTAVNAALRDEVLRDQAQYVQLDRKSFGTTLDTSPYPGKYGMDFSAPLMSASSTVVSTMYPSLKLFPGGNDGEGWMYLTASVPSGVPVELVDLLNNQSRGLQAIATYVESYLQANSSCAQNIYNGGLAATAQNYHNFALTLGGLDIGLAQGQYGDEACGEIRVTVPWSVAGPQLNATGQSLRSGLR